MCYGVEMNDIDMSRLQLEWFCNGHPGDWRTKSGGTSFVITRYSSETGDGVSWAIFYDQSSAGSGAIHGVNALISDAMELAETFARIKGLIPDPQRDAMRRLACTMLGDADEDPGAAVDVVMDTGLYDAWLHARSCASLSIDEINGGTDMDVYLEITDTNGAVMRMVEIRVDDANYYIPLGLYNKIKYDWSVETIAGQRILVIPSVDVVDGKWSGTFKVLRRP